MIGQDSDAAVLAYLRAEGPCTVMVKRLAEKTGIPRVTVRTSVAALALDGLVCVIANIDESAYTFRHIHAAPGTCGHSLGCTVFEEPS